MVQGSGGIANEAGVNNTDTLYFYPVATKENDLNLVQRKRER